MSNPYRLEAIALHEVGVFDDVRIDFPPKPEAAEGKAEIHVFTGPNGCGKSTLLYALAEIFKKSIADTKKKPTPGLIWRRFRGKKSYVEFELCNTIGMYAENSSLRAKNGDEAFKQVAGNYFGLFGYGVFPIRDMLMSRGASLSITALEQYKKRSESSFFSDDNYSFSAFAYSGQRNIGQHPIEAIKEITSSPFENALSFNENIRPQLILQWIANNRTKSALAKVDGDMADVKRYDSALHRITQVIHDICDLDIEFKLSRSPLEVTLKVGDDNLQFDTLPDGLKSIISWIADLAMRLEAIPWENQDVDIFSQPIILFLDEIDIHLHPKWQRRVLPTVQKLFPNAQIFASTHSPFVVGSVEDAWVYRLPEKGKATSRVIEAVPSGAGKSYRLILEEIFGIDEEFDVETEALFDRFYQCREVFLLEPGARQDELLGLARALAEKSEEAGVIVGRELRQLSRLSGREITLA